jgi:hypothetical protein
MPDDTHIDLRPRVAALEQMLVERTAERDEAPQRKTSTRFTHPPPPRATGRTQSCAALPDRIAARSPGDPRRAGVGVTDRRAVGVMPRTDPW